MARTHGGPNKEEALSTEEVQKYRRDLGVLLRNTPSGELSFIDDHSFERDIMEKGTPCLTTYLY
jgi:hypothetical protein